MSFGPGAPFLLHSGKKAGKYHFINVSHVKFDLQNDLAIIYGEPKSVTRSSFTYMYYYNL